ncbi:MAG: signal peptidase [Pseudomonadota bacterium]
MSVAENNKPEEKNAFWETIVVLVQAFLLAAVIRTVLLQPFTIPSGSMIPTLLVGDYLLVNKFAYGYSRYSLPLYNPEWFKGRLFGSEPERGDVVVFRLPSDTSTDYIKRLIGLPGDKVQMIDGVLHVNGKAVPKVAEGTYNSDDSETSGRDVPVYRETLDNGVSYDTLDLNPFSDGDNTQEFVVPPKHYFFMGDNRDNSLDSRFTVGYVPEENLVGRATFIIFSIGNKTPFYEVWNWPANLRLSRFFKGIQ